MNLILLVLRFVAGVPLLGLGLKHLIDLYRGDPHFLNIVEAANLIPGWAEPYTHVILYFVGMMEAFGGIMMIGGVMAHLGGLFGLAAMVPAVYATLELSKMENAPFVPPLPVPLVIAVCSGLVALLGSGAWGIDGMRYAKKDTAEPAPQ